MFYLKSIRKEVQTAPSGLRGVGEKLKTVQALWELKAELEDIHGRGR